MNSQTEQTWGVQINRRGYGNKSIPEACLPWIRPIEKNDWQKKGVVIWSNQAQQVEILSANHSLQLIDYMQTKDTWKAEGIPITRQYTRIVLPDDRKKKKGNRKKDENPIEAEEQTSTSETVVEERFRLNPTQSAEFLQILETNEALLREMAKEEEQECSRAFMQVYSFLFKGAREEEIGETDLSARPFEWEKDAVTGTLIYNRPPNRGSILLTDHNFFWQGCIEQPHQFKHTSPHFVKLEEALTWVEQQLEKIEQEADEPEQTNERQRIPRAELLAQKQAELTAFWIEPAALEPERITYQALINLDYAPSSYKEMEMSFGEKFYYDQKFATPTQLAKELHLDPQLDVEQYFNGSYTLVSRVTYYREDMAAAQAQRFWEQSSIVQQHRVGKVIRAQYGTAEVETGYEVIIGACENPKDPYPPTKSRQEHLAWLALGETLEYALDVDGYRSYLGWRRASDEQLLDIMHSHRARSRHVPMEAQLESERRLRVNNVK